MTEKVLRVLFVCTGNSCRSQMAEALTRHLSNGRVESFSAGTNPHPINPLTVRDLSQIGIDISGQSSKHLSIFRNEQFDYVITVCDGAKESCPTWPGVKDQIHWSIEDPALVQGTDDQKMHAFKVTRIAITNRIRLFLNSVGIQSETRKP